MPNASASGRPRKFPTRGRRRVNIISFPKCGRTWVRVLLGRALQRHFRIEGLPSFKKILKVKGLARYHPEIPVIEITHDDNPHWKRPDELERDKSRYADRSVAFLVRDPRDVIVSLFFHQRLRVSETVDPLKEDSTLKGLEDRIKPYRGSLSEFIREPMGGFDSLLAFLDIWNEARPALRALEIVRYEDLKSDPAGKLRRLLEFFGIGGVSDAIVAEAAEFASFDNMKRLEREGAFRTHKLEPRNPSDNESYKVRRGVVGGYRDYLSPEDIAWVDGRMARGLSPAWGYPPCRQGG